MGWIIFLIVIAIVILLVILASFMKSFNMGYRWGSGLFKSSESNLDEKQELSDKTYFRDDGLLK